MGSIARERSSTPARSAAIGAGAGAAVLLLGLVLGLRPLGLGVGVVATSLGTGATLELLAWRSGSDRGLAPWTVLLQLGAAGVFVLGVMQLVPYGYSHDNPDVLGEPAWSSPETRELVVRACYGCHSNETTWPWYSDVAPTSWLVANHVDSGRHALNFSEFTATQQRHASEAVTKILNGSMPPGYYTILGLHSEANLTDAEVAQLVDGLRNTPGFEGR